MASDIFLRVADKILRHKLDELGIAYVEDEPEIEREQSMYEQVKELFDEQIEDCWSTYVTARNNIEILEALRDKVLAKLEHLKPQEELLLTPEE